MKTAICEGICEGDFGHFSVGVIFGSFLAGLVGIPAAGIAWYVGVPLPNEYLSWGLLTLMAIIVLRVGRHNPEDIPLEVGMVIGAAAAAFIPGYVYVGVPMI
jgi:hypothetical protein